MNKKSLITRSQKRAARDKNPKERSRKVKDKPFVKMSPSEVEEAFDVLEREWKERLRRGSKGCTLKQAALIYRGFKVMREMLYIYSKILRKFTCPPTTTDEEMKSAIDKEFEKRMNEEA